MSTTTRTALQVVAAYREAWNARDADTCGALFTEDGVREAMVKPIMGVHRFAGRAIVTDSIRGFMDALPDLQIEIGDTWEVPGGAVLQWRITGTHTADWGTWRAQDESVSFPGISVLRITDGHIAEERLYYDTGLMTANWQPH